MGAGQDPFLPYFSPANYFIEPIKKIAKMLKNHLRWTAQLHALLYYKCRGWGEF